VLFRDLNPEKLIFSDEGTNPILKLADFHYAVNLSTISTTNSNNHETPLHGRVGRLGYMAPEMIKSNGSNNDGEVTKINSSTGGSNETVYGKSVDIWSIGIITYILLSGNSPFGESPDKQKLASAILEGEYEFQPLRIWKNVSEEGKDFITRLLEVVPTKRYSVDQCLAHDWIKSLDTIEKEEETKQKMTNEASFIDNSDVTAVIDTKMKEVLNESNKAEEGDTSSKKKESHHFMVVILHGLKGFTALKKFRKIIRVVILIERIKKLVIVRKENEEKRLQLGLPLPPPVVTKQPI
jgi:serine/threonine protein kinase